VEDGPESDTHLDVECDVLAAVAESGIPVPRVLFCDTSRRQVPFAIQVITYYDTPDLNRLHRAGGLSIIPLAETIGRTMAQWQAVPVEGFGPFKKRGANGALIGYHPSYAQYFNLNLERHLHLLKEDCFLSNEEVIRIKRTIEDCSDLLKLDGGCLVHKDLALWNILGTTNSISAVIDWDDAISGDPTDDLSLLACFHSADFLLPALRGYESVHPLPPQFPQRFWMHLLRNMIVKAVIRTGAGYFNQTKGNFLMPQGGAELRKFTRERLLIACRGLREGLPISNL
jgi:aminoglycoside phosphotransferase (APT) family kinase protein